MASTLHRVICRWSPGPRLRPLAVTKANAHAKARRRGFGDRKAPAAPCANCASPVGWPVSATCVGRFLGTERRFHPRWSSLPICCLACGWTSIAFNDALPLGGLGDGGAGGTEQPGSPDAGLRRGWMPAREHNGGPRLKRFPGRLPAPSVVRRRRPARALIERNMNSVMGGAWAA